MATNIAQVENLRAPISAFDDQEFAAHFYNEIKDMVKTTREIKRGFEQVSQDLKPFDDRRYKDGSVGLLRPIWDGYYEEYKTLLRTSKKDAVDLKLISDHYLEVVVPALPDKAVSAAEFQDIAKDFKEKTIAHERTSKYNADTFLALSRKLANFEHRDDKIDTIAAKTGAFGEFWTGVDIDEGTIIKKLDCVLAAPTTHGTYALRTHLGEKGAASLYAALRQALLHYTAEANV
ncbi:hypothetical protein BDN72DRAFT_850480 [Pluteus cervinus]|uniref:Uncharacterized protein n=1 Tax=Pluteus cervinus TaxID=181527 RepID=A0ACD3A463_9AGAR|nr:hypothetical protein BDN72DRAFT_850480 [Pluteus cervinus]